MTWNPLTHIKTILTASLIAFSALALSAQGAASPFGATVDRTTAPSPPGIPAAGTSLKASPANHIHQSFQSTRKGAFASHDFLYAASNGVWSGNAWSSGTQNGPTATDANHPGTNQFRSHASNANSGYGYLTNGAQWLMAGSEDSSCVVQFNVTAGQRFIFGWHATYTPASDPASAILFDLQGTTLRGLCIKTGVGTTATTSSYTITSNTAWYACRIQVNSAQTLVTFTLTNDAGTVLWTDTVSGANIPASIAMYHGAHATLTSPAGATVIATIDYLDILGNKGTQRGFL